VASLDLHAIAPLVPVVGDESEEKLSGKCRKPLSAEMHRNGKMTVVF
jgi:hypothetical protein